VTTKGAEKVAKGKPGRKADKRPQVAFKVEPSVYDALANLQATTGNTPDESAKLLLHILVLDTPNAAKRLEALLGSGQMEADANPSASNLRTLDASRRPAS
jgi:hypothetical protein